MCCFTTKVSVLRTSIFAREADGDRQYLVYQMSAKAAAEGALVLPLPVPKNAGEEALKFIDLSGYPGFFGDLADVMSHPVGTGAYMAIGGRGALAVQQVGAFEASFVPTLGDFARLDERFRLAPEAFAKLPAHRTFGFAVFKLKAGEFRTHPMAFSFPRRDAGVLFFPTVHIHDGTLHEIADFDHRLFAQTGGRRFEHEMDCEESPDVAAHKFDGKRDHGIVAGDQHVYCARLLGELPNQDITLKFR